MDKPGMLIVLEGSDGSGKTTQFNLLSERLKAAGYDVSVFDFPRYDKDSSYFIKQYLNGRYGPAADISPYTASLFYALDRYEAAKDIRRELNRGRIVLCNRYVGSNMAHQGAKFADPAEQRGFFVWEDNLEFQMLKIPRPDINLFLRVPAEVSHKLIDLKAARDYTAKVHDQHEADIGHLKKAVATYDLLCQLFPKDFQAIECTANNELLSIAEVSNLIWEKLKPILPPEKPHAGHSAIITLGGQPDLPRPDLSEPDKLVHEFKNASLLLKLNIEKQIKSVEPGGFSVWSDNGYKFYTPRGMDKSLETVYKATIGHIAELHKQMRQKLEHHYERSLLVSGNTGTPLPNISSLLLPATPLSALCSFTAVLSPKAVGRVSSSLLSNDTEELQWTAKQLFLAARQKWPGDFKNSLESDSAPEPLNNIIAKLAEEHLNISSRDSSQVKLLEALPRQEFDLLAESIYPYSNLSLEEITEEVSDWSYAQKYESLKQAAADPSILLEKIRYKFDLISDQIVFSEIINAAIVNNIQTQTPSPRYGYEVPAFIEDAGIDELYMECFDESLKLFSLLQQADKDDLTIYATLLGHKQRWQLGVNAQNMKAILDHKPGESYSKLSEAMAEAVGEVHPLVWEVLNGAPLSQHSRPSHKNRVKPAKRRPAKPKKSPNSRDK
jgi:dTMP kinase